MLIINASNVKGGGALQVTLSLINDLFDRSDILFIVSSVVNDNLKSNKINPKNLVVHDFIFFKSNLFFYRLLLNGHYNTFFTIFGPLYFIFTPKNVKFVSGFAQPWVVYPKYNILNLRLFLIYFFKYKIQSYFFKKNNILICESEFVETLIKRKFKDVNTYSVPNAISSIISDSQYTKLYSSFDGCLNFGLPSGYYLHKNLIELFHIQHHLKVEFDINSKIHLTLTQDNVDDLISKLPKHYCPILFNHGLVSSSGIENFYKCLDIVILPSHLECFSVTPLESLYFGIKTFVRDYSFNRAVYLDHVEYYNDVQTLSYNINDFIKYKYNSYDSCPGHQFSSSFTSGKRTSLYLKIVKELYVQK